MKWLILVGFRVIVDCNYLEWLWNDYEVAILDMAALFFAVIFLVVFFLKIIKWKWYFDERVWLWFLFCPESLILVEFFWNCLVVNICVFRCYFIIIYWILGRVRWNAWFIRVWLEFWWDSCDFLIVWKVVKMAWLVGFIEVDIEVFLVYFGCFFWCGFGKLDF